MKYIILARNAYLSEDIEDFLKDLQKGASPNIKKYITTKLRKFLENDFPATQIKKYSKTFPSWIKEALNEGEEVFKVQLKVKDKNTIKHWIDYLKTLPKTKDLSRLSISQLIKQVDKWDNSSTDVQFTKKKVTNTEKDGIEVIHKYSDGYKWVRVSGMKSIDREGKLMNYRVDSYYQQVKKNKTSIYSLRDKANKPHVTIEIKDNMINHVKGNLNKYPTEEYRKYILDFINKKYVEFDKVNRYELYEMNCIEINKKVYDISNMPEGSTVDSFDLKASNITKLPNNLTVNGSLDLHESDITELPDGLTVKGELNVSNTEISELPKNLTVKGGLDLAFSKITKLPNDLTVDGNLNLSYLEITKLPNNLTVKGRLILLGTKISELPNDLTVDGGLVLTDTNITKLPDGLTVKDDLVLRGTNISRLPNDLTIGGDLDISNTNITKLPDDLTIGGDLELRGTDITKLPKNLTVKGNLNLAYTNVTEISNGLTVKGLLGLRKSNVTKLPKKLNATIMLEDTKITELPDGLTIKGNLHLYGSDVTELPKGLTVSGYLALYGSYVTELPNDLTIGGVLDISRTKIKEIPKGVKAKEIKISDWMEVTNHSRCEVVIKR